MRTWKHWLTVTVFGTALLIGGCASQGGGGSGATDDDENGETDPGEDGTDGADGADGASDYVPPIKRGEGCEFDPAKAGKEPGDLAENFTLKESNAQIINGTELHDTFHMHSQCGTSKVVLMVLATGW